MDLLSAVEQDVGQAFRRAGRNPKRGIEHQGPCPWHGGTDGFHVWTETPSGKDNYWCRPCQRTGDLIQYLRDYRGLSWWEATGEQAPAGSSAPTTPAAPRTCAAPPVDWQCAAFAWLDRCRVALWDGARPASLRYLASRGLLGETVACADIGANLTTQYVAGPAWGLGKDEQVWLPRGIVFPWFCKGELWKLCIRRPNADLREGDAKYVTVKGSANALYGADALRPGQPAVIVEGVLDALAVQQSGAGVAAVASGTTGARELIWQVQLKACSAVLVALDADEPGEEHSRYWCDLLGGRAWRWRPLLNDPGAMLEQGMDVGAWLAAGLDAGRSAA